MLPHLFSWFPDLDGTAHLFRLSSNFDGAKIASWHKSIQLFPDCYKSDGSEMAF